MTKESLVKLTWTATSPHSSRSLDGFICGKLLQYLRPLTPQPVQRSGFQNKSHLPTAHHLQYDNKGLAVAAHWVPEGILFPIPASLYPDGHVRSTHWPIRLINTAPISRPDWAPHNRVQSKLALNEDYRCRLGGVGAAPCCYTMARISLIF